jgi:hypothetical protein
MRPHLPSLGLVLEEARSERQAQLVHFEALDAKAGVILGFSGALVALTPYRGGMLIAAGRILAVLSGIAALGSFWPRRYSITDLRSLRDKYLAAEESFTRLKLVDATVAEAAQVRNVLIRKSLMLKGAMLALALAVISIAAAVT